MDINTKTVGDIGEALAKKYLISRGYRIIVQNYRKKWGEIDIIAYTDKFHIIEVKTLMVNRREYESPFPTFDPKDKVDRQKIKKINSLAKSYFNSISSPDADRSYGVISILLEDTLKRARVEYIENIEL